MFRLYRKNDKISAVTWANSIVSQEQLKKKLISNFEEKKLFFSLYVIPIVHLGSFDPAL